MRIRTLSILGATLVVALFAASCTSTTTTTTGSTTGSSSPTTVSPTASASPTPTPVPASWTRLASMPAMGSQVEAVWADDELLVFGRTSLNHEPYCKDVAAAYDPNTDTWRRLPGAPGPVGCFEGGDRAVWTGEEVLLWGVTNTAFDPATETWRKLPEPPAGAGGPSVIGWTGTQMLGWGGGCCGGVDADGAAYTPSTNRWKLLPPAPISGRHGMGVWTGAELVIVGGSGPDMSEGTPVYVDGAAYDPATRSWRPLPDMPVPREAGEAFWDGDEVLVVGGRNADQPLPRGVAYDPASDTWRWLPPMTYARSGFAGAWTGELLVVWGGRLYREPVPGSGEAYDPNADAWTLLPRAPLRARTSPLDGWTGRELLIFGGWDARTGDPRTDGAALTPPSG
jgi:N-acetylneuraminic acid mutarotase